jgi:Nif-specific regulatory protein
MRAIRSLLWIGSGEGLAASGVSEAPTLDVTWVPDVDAAYALPPIAFDGAVIEAPITKQLVSDMRRLKRRPRCPPILACLPEASADEIRALLSAGAHEVIVQAKDEEAPRLLDELLDRLDRITKRDRAQPSVGDRGEDSSPTAQTAIVGRSRAMRDVCALVERAGSSQATVLLTGDTGTGKERIARQIHDGGGRRRGPFVAINCAAFPESLLESELFGHRRGSFSGAERDKAGHFELAHRGTIFLDEIGETSPALQAKLLRVLQEREVLPVGATRPHPIDVQVIAATNRSLTSDVETGRFRQDLYYRLAVFPIRVPALRERPEDILPLASHFLERHGARENKIGCRLSAASQRLLQSHRWPGNVRELENEMQRALALAEPGELITPKLLTPHVLGIVEAIDQTPPGVESLRENLECVEAWLIRRALEHNGGRRTVTAKKLGVTREGLYKKMKRLGIE